MDGINQKITKKELNQIRSLPDFDLKMLISEIHDHGWIHPMYKSAGGKALLPFIIEALGVVENRKSKN